ncbi:MAG: hypothetical protein HYR70_10560 [Chloroflexi bacterium]|nr:hypothetical protein [Chloroflexota bacterium]MBI3340349.1 hypothetical protein [Chloroflexota bacterium]
MKKSKFSESQIVNILKEAETGVSLEDLIRQPDERIDCHRETGQSQEAIEIMVKIISGNVYYSNYL